MLRRALGIVGLTLIWAGAAVVLVWHTLLVNWNAPLNLGTSGYRFEFTRGSSVSMLIRDLHAAGILPHPRSARLLARWRGDGGRLQAGEYDLHAGMNSHALFDLLLLGRVVQHPFTIIEGWRFSDLRAALASATTLIGATRDLSDAELMAAIGLPDRHPEGRFLPDTYLHARNTSDRVILRQAAEALNAALEHAWAGRAPDLPLQGPDELLVLASIVEKETGMAAERAEIAGVFVRRLRLGMRLQTDPTVIYGLGTRYDGNLRRRDLTTDTPYNTYTRAGLPPTPIALPGKAALAAAARPAERSALYFVARGDGSHEFSDTLEAHNRAVARYQLGRGP